MRLGQSANSAQQNENLAGLCSGSPSDVEQKVAETRRVETGRMQFGNDWPGVFIRRRCTVVRRLTTNDVGRGRASRNGIGRSGAASLVTSQRAC